MAQVGQKSETWKQKRANMRASVSMRVRVRACACAMVFRYKTHKPGPSCVLTYTY